MSKNATISLSSFSAMFGVFCMNDFLFMFFVIFFFGFFLTFVNETHSLLFRFVPFEMIQGVGGFCKWEQLFSVLYHFIFFIAGKYIRWIFIIQTAVIIIYLFDTLFSQLIHNICSNIFCFFCNIVDQATCIK